MTSPRLLWPIFFLLTVVTLVATGWVSVRVVRLERERIDEDRHAKVEENVSLALWRIDSLVAPLVAIENARPFQDFGVDPENWCTQVEEEPKLANRYFTVELLPDPKDQARYANLDEIKSIVQVVNGDTPKLLRDPNEVVRLFAALPEPTIRLSEPPMMQFSSPRNPLKSKTQPVVEMYDFDIQSLSKKGQQQIRSNNEFNARQSTFKRMMNTVNPLNLKQNYQSESSQSMVVPSRLRQPLPGYPPLMQEAVSMPQQSAPIAPPQHNNAPRPNGSLAAPMPAALPQEQAVPAPAPNEGTFYLPSLPLLRMSLVPVALCQSGFMMPNSSQDQAEASQQSAAPPFTPLPPGTTGPSPYGSSVPQRSAPSPTSYSAPFSIPVPQGRVVPQAVAVPLQQAKQPMLGTAEDFWAPMQPVCIGDQLFLLRRARLGSRLLLQGCLLDWPQLAQFLEKEVADLLPNAQFVLDEKKNTPGRMLASLPVRLEPGKLPGIDTLTFSTMLTPVLTSVAIAFGSVLLSIGAFAVLLVGMLRLGRRRSEFVTAVTHELRTPLTTFRMYSEMLSEGMVEEDSQKSYLQTLESEADRLTHLVENVLSSARLERGRHAGRLETMPIGELITPIASRLAKRCERAEMQLAVEIDETVNGTTIQTNQTAVEQILWNLIDNACKYAVSADDRTIRLKCDILDEKNVAITVSDRGPGIPREVRRRLFRGFSKTASEAARSAPGVGLGLALSRRLARDLGGNLELLATDHGASFRLRLELLHKKS